MNSRNRYTNPLRTSLDEIPLILCTQPNESDEEYRAFVDHCASWFDISRLLAPIPKPANTEDLEAIVGPLSADLRALSQRFNWPKRFIAWRRWLLPVLKKKWRMYANVYGMQLLFSRKAPPSQKLTDMPGRN